MNVSDFPQKLQTNDLRKHQINPNTTHNKKTCFNCSTKIQALFFKETLSTFQITIPQFFENITKTDVKKTNVKQRDEIRKTCQKFL